MFISLSYTVFGSIGGGVFNLIDTATDTAYEQIVDGKIIYSNGFHEGVLRGAFDAKTPSGYRLSS